MGELIKRPAITFYLNGPTRGILWGEAKGNIWREGGSTIIVISIFGCVINTFPFLWFTFLTFCSHYRWKYNLSSWWRDVSGMIPKNVGRIHKIWEARPFKEWCIRKNSMFILSLLGREYLQSQYWGRDFSCLGLGRWKSSKVSSANYSDKSSNKNSRKNEQSQFTFGFL